MGSKIPITMWYSDVEREDKTHFWDFNHMEAGTAVGEYPEPKFPAQMGWKNKKWKKELASLIDGYHVIKG